MARLSRSLASLALGVVTALACAGAPVSRLAPATLPGSDGAVHALPANEAGARFTVLVFVSRDCGIVEVHEPRLRALSRELGGRGVRFFAVDPEVGVELAEHRETGRRLGFPVLVDRGARLAKAAGARYSAYAVVLDADGQVHYRGGIDSDRARLTSDADDYLRDALADLLGGKPVRRASAPALGCALRTF